MGEEQSVVQGPSTDAYRRLCARLSSTDRLIRCNHPTEVRLRAAPAKMQTAARRTKHGMDVEIVEILFEGVGIHDYDLACFSVTGLMTVARRAPRLVIFVIADLEEFQQSVLLDGLLKLAEASSATSILALEATGAPGVVLASTATPLPSAPSFGDDPRDLIPVDASPVDLKALAGEFGILFDHFYLPNSSGGAYHVSTVASCRRLAANDSIVDAIRRDAAEMLSSSDFSLVYCGLPGGHVERLALALADGDPTRVFDLTALPRSTHSRVLLLCDFVASFHPLSDIVRSLRSGGADSIALIGIARYADGIVPDGVQSRVYLELGPSASVSRPTDCSFCDQGVPLLRAIETADQTAFASDATPGVFDAYLHGIGAFHPYVFWQLLRSDPAFLLVGHWRSPVTPNHFQFRIACTPVFETHAYGIATRMRNEIIAKGIIPDWVHGIVCTGGEESGALALALAGVLHVPMDAILRVPRRLFRGIAGPDIGMDLATWLQDPENGAERIMGRNVIVLDQAAHHLRTFRSLKRVCEHLESTVLAFSVFVDRTGHEMALGEDLYDAHYLPMYSWECPPRLSHDCPCVKVAG
jgi:hypothetical protein